MRRSLGLLPLALAGSLSLGLTACGSDDGDSAADPAPTSTSTQASSRPPSPTGTPPDQTGPDQTQPGGSDSPGFEVIGLYSATAAGGRASNRLTRISTDAELDAYVAQFRGEALASSLRDAVQGVGGDGELMAAVVGLGCDVPPGVEVTPTGDTFTVQAKKVVDPLQECLAPVTTVAVVSVGT